MIPFLLVSKKKPIGENTWWALYHSCIDCLSTTIGQIFFSTHLTLVVFMDPTKSSSLPSTELADLKEN